MRESESAIFGDAAHTLTETRSLQLATAVDHVRERLVAVVRKSKAS